MTRIVVLVRSNTDTLSAKAAIFFKPAYLNPLIPYLGKKIFRGSDWSAEKNPALFPTYKENLDASRGQASGVAYECTRIKAFVVNQPLVDSYSLLLEHGAVEFDLCMGCHISRKLYEFTTDDREIDHYG